MSYNEETELTAGVQAHSRLRDTLARIPKRDELPGVISEVKRLIGALEAWYDRWVEAGKPAGDNDQLARVANMVVDRWSQGRDRLHELSAKAAELAAQPAPGPDFEKSVHAARKDLAQQLARLEIPLLGELDKTVRAAVSPTSEDEEENDDSGAWLAELNRELAVANHDLVLRSPKRRDADLQDMTLRTPGVLIVLARRSGSWRRVFWIHEDGDWEWLADR